jgi:Tfp pilus tip-associated adhesin PilY1
MGDQQFTEAAPEPTASTATTIPSFFIDATGPYAQASGFAVSFNPSAQTSVIMDARIGGSVLASTTVPGTARPSALNGCRA